MRSGRTSIAIALLACACGNSTSKPDVSRRDASTTQTTARPRRAIEQLVAGNEHTCVLFADGFVHCWGQGASGRLGNGSDATIGDDEPAAAGADVVLGGPADELAAGSHHTCARMTTGGVRCWGEGENGRLGYGNTRDVGADITPAEAGDVELGEPAIHIAAGSDATCAVLASGAVRCWGEGDEFQLGYGDDGPYVDDVGDDEAPIAVPAFRFPQKVKQLAMQGATACALLEDGAVRCWGGSEGVAHNSDHRPATKRPNVPLGTKAVALGVGGEIMCAITTEGKLRCWGRTGAEDVIGNGANFVSIGPNRFGYPTPEALGDVPHLSGVEQMTGGAFHTCVLLSGGRVRCWGDQRFGQSGCGRLVSGHLNLAQSVDLKLPAAARQIAAGEVHTCALLEDNTVRCWGGGEQGQLGYGSTENICEAASAPPVPL